MLFFAASIELRENELESCQVHPVRLLIPDLGDLRMLELIHAEDIRPRCVIAKRDHIGDLLVEEWC